MPEEDQQKLKDEMRRYHNTRKMVLKQLAFIVYCLQDEKRNFNIC